MKENVKVNQSLGNEIETEENKENHQDEEYNAKSLIGNDENNQIITHAITEGMDKSKGHIVQLTEEEKENKFIKDQITEENIDAQMQENEQIDILGDNYDLNFNNIEERDGDYIDNKFEHEESLK